MKDAGYAHMGVGRASGKDKAVNAANMAISSPLLETSIRGARGVIINITASPDIGLDEVEQASEMIHAAAHEDANIIWGAGFNDEMNDEMSVTVIATGFAEDRSAEQALEHDVKEAESSRSVSSENNSVRADAAPAKQRQERFVDDKEDEEFKNIMEIFERR